MVETQTGKVVLARGVLAPSSQAPARCTGFVPGSQGRALPLLAQTQRVKQSCSFPQHRQDPFYPPPAVGRAGNSNLEI
jgi:hypothetical protein